MGLPGKQLRKSRRDAEIHVVTLAAEMRVHRATVWSIERRQVVDDATAARYLAALATVMRRHDVAR